MGFCFAKDNVRLTGMISHQLEYNNIGEMEFITFSTCSLCKVRRCEIFTRNQDHIKKLESCTLEKDFSPITW